MLITAPTCQKCKHTESDKLSVQIQAYLDNVFDVGGLLEDAETKNAALEKVEELEDHLSHVSALPILDHQSFLSVSLGPVYESVVVYYTCTKRNWFNVMIRNSASVCFSRAVQDNDGCRAMESTARGTILILFSYWPTASASHGALQKTSFTWKRS